MKGLIFTEFIEMVESQFGFEVSNQIIEKAHLPSEGVYTAVGTYPEEEMVALLVQLSQHAKMTIPDLLEAFGEYLFSRFSKLYGHFFSDNMTAFDFIDKIETYIHVEVLKLYPDALLPSIEIHDRTDTSMIMVYRSPRKLVHLAIGLIKGCSKHFKVDLHLEVEKSLKDGEEVWLKITAH